MTCTSTPISIASFDLNEEEDEKLIQEETDRLHASNKSI